MSLPTAWPQVLHFFGAPLVLEPPVRQLSGHAGLLAVRQLDKRIELTQANACALDGPCDTDLTEHSFPERVRACVFGILAGRPDQDDHDNRLHY
jgi:hypothetical protein